MFSALALLSWWLLLRALRLRTLGVGLVRRGRRARCSSRIRSPRWCWSSQAVRRRRPARGAARKHRTAPGAAARATGSRSSSGSCSSRPGTCTARRLDPDASQRQVATRFNPTGQLRGAARRASCSQRGRVAARERRAASTRARRDARRARRRRAVPRPRAGSRVAALALGVRARVRRSSLVPLARALGTYFAYRRIESLVPPLLLLVVAIGARGRRRPARSRLRLDRKVAYAIGAVGRRGDPGDRRSSATIAYYGTEKTNYRALRARSCTTRRPDESIVVGSAAHRRPRPDPRLPRAGRASTGPSRSSSPADAPPTIPVTPQRVAVVDRRAARPPGHDARRR